jgi:acyl-CoA synthetase (NDP forming)
MADLDALLNPGSVVVIGASEDHSSVRGHCCETILRHGYDGRVSFVSRSAPSVFGSKTVPDLAALDHVPDLAVLLTPAAACADVLKDCADRGIRAAFVVASGFAEEGTADGRARQEALSRVARDTGIALSGPNGEGFVDYVSGLAATFSPVLRMAEPIVAGQTKGGGVTVLAQSGAIGFGLADLALARGIALDRIITTGNEAGLTLTDYMDFLVEENRARSLLIFAEGIRDGVGFLAAARRARARGIGLTVLRVGKSETGKNQAASHTGALASDDRMLRDLLAEAGVADAADPVEAVECAHLLSALPARPMAGRGIGICSSTGGGAGLLADACEGAGLTIPALGAATRAVLDAVLPSYASSVNPVDATAGGIRAFGYTKLAEIVSKDAAVDAIIVAASGRTIATLGKEADALAAFARGTEKPVIFWSYTTPSPEFQQILARAGLRAAVGPGAVARALAAMAQHVGDAPEGTPHPVVPAGVLTEARSYPVIEAIGLSAGAWSLCPTAAEAEAFARTRPGPVALKIQSPAIPHKTEAGGVALNVAPGEVAATFERIVSASGSFAPDAPIDGVLVQDMAHPGTEVIIGGFRDPSFGPVVMVGLGGVLTEFLGDVSFAAAPVTNDTAEAMIGRLRGRKILDGTRGRPPSDRTALAAAVVAVSRLMAAPSVREVDLNPVFVHETGLTVADALIFAEEQP